ncbi:MAG: hypothetical protein AAFR50_11815, partial [Pseudomonadota bacterium]
MIRSLTAALFIAFGTQAATQVDTSGGSVSITPVVTGLSAPWGFGFLKAMKSAAVSERIMSNSS